MELSLSASLVERQDEHLEASRQPLKSDISRMPGAVTIGHHMSPPPSTTAPGRKKAAPKLPQPHGKDANDLRFI